MSPVVMVLLIALLLGGLVFFVGRAQKEADAEVIGEAGKVINADAPTTLLAYGDRQYKVRHGLDAVLLIGTDDIEGKAGTKPEDNYNYNYNLADFLILLVIDDNARTVQPIQINRDTMAEVPWIGLNGKKGGYQVEQITFAHTYGNGVEDSCENTVDAVSRFLFEAPIDRYMAVTMDAVPIVNDLVGGVTIRCPGNISELGDEYTDGAVITLKGFNALRFVRYRDTSTTASNVARLDRHRVYLEAFLPQAKKAFEKNSQLVLDALETLDPYLVTDMSGNEISELVNRMNQYDILPAATYKGTYQLGTYAEFYADNASVWEIVKDAYCE